MLRSLLTAGSTAVLLATAAAAQTTPAPAPATATPAVQPIRASKIVLVGDSTTAVIGGWGRASARGT